MNTLNIVDGLGALGFLGVLQLSKINKCMTIYYWQGSKNDMEPTLIKVIKRNGR